MKNKKVLYLLIPGTLLVWGMIIYKIVVGAGGSEDNSVQKVALAPEKQDLVLDDTFSIHPTYRDPFSAKQIKKMVAVNSGQTIKKVVVPVVTANWPQITYGGIVKNQKSSKQLVLVLINGQSVMMKVGEVANNIELIKVFRDSIEVRFGKEKKFIRK